MNISAGYPYLIQIGIAIVVSFFFGSALLKIYEDFQKAIKNKNRLKLWWACFTTCFLLSMIVFLFGNKL